jgi:elongation factor 2
MFVTNVHTNEAGDTVASGRLFSGKIKKTDRLRIIEAFNEVEVKAVSIDMGALREEVPEVSAGNLATLTLAGRASAGQTLVDLSHGSGMMPFEAITYVSEPVVTLAVEPKNPQDIEALQKALEKLSLRTEPQSCGG